MQLAQMRISSSFSIKFWGCSVVGLLVGVWGFCWFFFVWGLVFFLEVHPAFGVGKGCAKWVPAGGDRCICTITDCHARILQHLKSSLFLSLRVGALPRVCSLGYKTRVCFMFQNFRSCGGAFPWILWMRRKLKSI